MRAAAPVSPPTEEAPTRLVPEPGQGLAPAMVTAGGHGPADRPERRLAASVGVAELHLGRFRTGLRPIRTAAPSRRPGCRRRSSRSPSSAGRRAAGSCRRRRGRGPGSRAGPSPVARVGVAPLGEQVGRIVRAPELEGDDVVDLEGSPVVAHRHPVLGLDGVPGRLADVAHLAGAEARRADDGLGQPAVVGARRAAPIGLGALRAAARLGARPEQDGRAHR